MNISAKVEYGLHLISNLSQEANSKSLMIIAKEENLSFSFLQQVAQLLKKSGILNSSRGKTGGYTLVKPINSIKLKEIIETLDGEINLVPCLKKDEKNSCKKEKNCKIKEGLKKVNQDFNNFFAEKSLSEII